MSSRTSPANFTQMQIRGVSQVFATDGDAQHTITWDRTFAVGTTAMTITLQDWWDSVKVPQTPDHHHTIQFPPTTDTLNNGNGVYQTDTLSDSDGKAWSTTTYAYNATGAGVDASLSSVHSVTVAQDGAPTLTTSLGYATVLDLAVQTQNVVATDSQTPISSVTYGSAAWPDMLANRLIGSIDTTRYKADGTAWPTITQAFNFVPGSGDVPLLQVWKSYLSASGWLHGSQFTYDGEGRLSGVDVYHAEYGLKPSPNHTTLNYDQATGASSGSSIKDLTGQSDRTLDQTLDHFDSAGRATWSTDAAGVTTTYSFDDRGRVRSTSRPGTSAVATTYYAGEKTVDVQVDQMTTTNTYDGFGRLVKVHKPTAVPANGGAASYTDTAYGYDQHGWLNSITETNPVGKVRTQSIKYDLLGRVSLQTPFTGAATKTDYFVSGLNRKATATRGDQVRSTLLDPFGQVVEVDDPDGTISKSIYDAMGHRTSLTVTKNADSQTRSWTYDILGRLTEKTEPETNLQTFDSFNALNQPTSVTEWASVSRTSGSDTRVRTLGYDGFGRLRSMTNGGDSLTLHYQGPNLDSATRAGAGGVAVSQAYTFNGPGGLLDSETTTRSDLASTKIIYEYRSNGQLKNLTYPSSQKVGYVYDNLNRVTAINVNTAILDPGNPLPATTQPSVPLVKTISYDDWGNRNLLTFASQALDSWTWDLDTGTQLSNSTTAYYPGGLTTGPDTRSYSYDPVTNLLTSAGEWSKLVHDPMGRLTEADGFGLTTGHTYDPFGNAISHTVGGTTLAPPTLINFNLGVQQFNQVPSKDVAQRSTGWSTNKRGEATSVGLAVSGSTVLLGWDGLGLMNAAVGNGVTQSYQYAPSGMRVQVDDTSVPGNSRRYAYTTGGLLLSEYKVPQNVWAGQRALQVPHNPAQFSGVAKYLGSFSAGETVTASVWFKAPCGVHGEMFLGDAGGATPYDQCSYVSQMGTGDWQQLTLSHTMTHDDQMWVYLYSDQWSVADPSKVPAHAGTAYDSLLVTSSNSAKNPVLHDEFEGTWPNTAEAQLDPGPWVSGVDGVSLDGPGCQLAWRRDIVYLGGLAVAELDGNGVHELHSDQLGTPRLVTKGSGDWGSNLVGTSEATQVYGAYGELIAQTGTYIPTTGYTGHILTDATGLIYMRGRYYSPAWHAFVNADQGVDPDNWNQRAYVGSSPFMAVDPSGLEEKKKMNKDKNGNVDGGGETVDVVDIFAPVRPDPWSLSNPSLQPAIALGIDFVGFIPGAKVGAGLASIINDHSKTNIGVTAVAVLAKEVVATSVSIGNIVHDGILFVVNGILGPMFNSAPSQKVGDGNGQLVSNPALMSEFELCNNH